MKGHLDKKQLEEEYKVDDLRELAKSLGLSPDGRKTELVERIAAAEVDVSDDDEQQAADANVSETDTTVEVIVTQTYKDLQRDITQHAGDTFEVTKERAAQLIEAGVAKAAE
ncbi:SAP domain-containing protein [Lachnospira eligens]|jgi:hypothetical protein|uniref:SAP domain-containing protein n=1 Tax=Lachnospira eligens TaxID=39485 RepID=A0A7C9LC86_9FIRM|nr:SAP domain-containing protein [Lachnospira eligens]MSC57773.1 hypothetical protein [Lachnospira eligens]DAJ79499.1 MAG TPA: SAP domain [Caudoviricetes sp.]